MLSSTNFWINFLVIFLILGFTERFWSEAGPSGSKVEVDSSGAVLDATLNSSAIDATASQINECQLPGFTSDPNCNGNCTKNEFCKPHGYGCFDCRDKDLENKTTTPYVAPTAKPLSTPSSFDQSALIGLIVGCVLGAILLIVIFGAITFIMRKRRIQNGEDSTRIRGAYNGQPSTLRPAPVVPKPLGFNPAWTTATVVHAKY